MSAPLPPEGPVPSAPPPPDVVDSAAPAIRFEDLTIDDGLSPLRRLTRYATSSIALQRLVHVRTLGEVAAGAGYGATSREIMPLLPALATDAEGIIRQTLALELRPLAEAILKSTDDYVEEGDGEGGDRRSGSRGQGYAMVRNVVLAFLSTLLADALPEVRLAAGSSLVSVSRHLSEEDRRDRVLASALRLAGDASSDDMRVTAAALLNDLSEVLGPVTVRGRVVEAMGRLVGDEIFKVRRAAAMNLHHVCRIGSAAEGNEEDGRRCADYIVELFLKLSQDEIFRVRKACAESIVEMSRAVPDSTYRYNGLGPVMMKLLGDTSRLVRQSALQHLGPLISTIEISSTSADATDKIAKEENSDTSCLKNLPPISSSPFPSELITDLVSHYVAMSSDETGDVAIDADLRLHCAFSFPAVFLTVGKNGWGLLRECYINLSRDEITAVRRCMACSVHEVARILGPVLVESELLGIFEGMVHDSVEAVRIGAVRNLNKFLAILPRKIRVRYIPLLREIFVESSPMNWRLRDHVARQLPEITRLFDVGAVASDLAPLAFSLLDDAVSEVRASAFATVPFLLRALRDPAARVADPEADPPDAAELEEAYEAAAAALQDAVERLGEFAKSSNFARRQSFCTIFASIAQEEALRDIVSKLLPLALEMQTDPVVNVRSTLRRALRALPEDLRKKKDTAVALKELDNEEATWGQLDTTNGEGIGDASVGLSDKEDEARTNGSVAGSESMDEFMSVGGDESSVDSKEGRPPLNPTEDENMSNEESLGGGSS